MNEIYIEIEQDWPTRPERNYIKISSIKLNCSFQDPIMCSELEYWRQDLSNWHRGLFSLAHWKFVRMVPGFEIPSFLK